MIRKAKGFTLIELLIVVAIVGILAMLLIPNAITAMQKAKQKGTMKDVATISTCMTDYMTDNGRAYTANGTYSKGGDFYTTMSPFYIVVLPTNDQWGNPFRVFGGTNCSGEYGLSTASNQDFMVESWGRDGTQETDAFATMTTDTLYVVSGMTSFDHDLVQWNGNWLRGPDTRAGSSGS